MPQPSRQEAHKQLGVGEAEWLPEEFSDLTNRLQNYCRGRSVSFPDALDLCEGTSFQHEVWRVTRLISYGETRSYRWVAEQMGKPTAARAVGQALARNPLPIVVPCHRVVASNGELTGFAGGLEMKQRLLSLEASKTLAIATGK